MRPHGVWIKDYRRLTVIAGVKTLLLSRSVHLERHYCRVRGGTARSSAHHASMSWRLFVIVRLAPRSDSSLYNTSLLLNSNSSIRLSISYISIMAIIHIVLFEWKSTASEDQVSQVGRLLHYHTATILTIPGLQANARTRQQLPPSNLQ